LPHSIQAAAKRIPTLATVNGRSISRQQLAKETMRRFGSDVLESIINKLLIMNELKQQGIQITEGDINNAIVEKAEKFGMSADRYMKLIQTRRNVSSDRYKNDIVWNELALRRLAEAAIEVWNTSLARRCRFVRSRCLTCRKLG
jgi:FKBP-type peptidyl-prolyl cis-trans isomerase (trigger factor)